MPQQSFYSQFGEDRILNNIFNKKKGLCIEIGGFDGITGSNTYFFEKLGWDTIIIEPIPEYCEKIKKSRSCRIVNVAASSSNGETNFFVAQGVETLSSIVPDVDRIIKAKGNLQSIVVQTRTLDSIIDDLKIERTIDFITIDVEGHELDVLKGFSFKKYVPSILIIEENDVVDVGIKKFLRQHGYIRFKKTDCNNWYTPAENKSIYSEIDILKTELHIFYLRSKFLLKKAVKKVLHSVFGWKKNA